MVLPSHGIQQACMACSGLELRCTAVQCASSFCSTVRRWGPKLSTESKCDAQKLQLLLLRDDVTTKHWSRRGPWLPMAQTNFTRHFDPNAYRLCKLVGSLLGSWRLHMLVYKRTEWCRWPTFSHVSSWF